MGFNYVLYKVSPFLRLAKVMTKNLGNLKGRRGHTCPPMDLRNITTPYKTFHKITDHKIEIRNRYSIFAMYTLYLMCSTSTIHSTT